MFDIFNRYAFVWWDIDNPQPALQQIMELDADPVKYKAMQDAPMLANGKPNAASRNCKVAVAETLNLQAQTRSINTCH